MMQELIFENTGLPQDVLQLREAPMPEPKSHEVLVQITARNINPSDLMFVRGMYGIVPKLPSSAGFEASGVVIKSDEAGKIPVGMRVMFTAVGTWKTHIAIPAALVIPVPEEMSDEIACQAFVNPITAYAMIQKSGLKAGEWLLITAGASAFGKFAIQMAKAAGIKVAATVRHEDQKEYLIGLGADLVINSETEKLQKLIMQHTGDGISVVFDAVGGILGAKALASLRQGGKMMVFDMMCRRALERELHAGKKLADQQTIQNWIAESRAEIKASRLMVLDTAQKMEEFGAKAVREDISTIKFFVADVLMKVIDRAIQVHGALGITDDTLLSFWYRHERGARIYDGPDEVHKSALARSILKNYTIENGQSS